MKIFRDGKCYVNIIDLTRYPIPSYFVIDKSFCVGNDMVIIDEEKSMEYIKNRQDILDYDSIHDLSEKELDLKIKQVYLLLDSYAKKYLNTPLELRVKLYKDDKYIRGYKFHEYVYYDLLKYQNNRKEIDDYVSGIIPPRNSQLKKVK